MIMLNIIIIIIRDFLAFKYFWGYKLVDNRSRQIAGVLAVVVEITLAIFFYYGILNASQMTSLAVYVIFYVVPLGLPMICFKKINIAIILFYNIGLEYLRQIINALLFFFDIEQTRFLEDSIMAVLFIAVAVIIVALKAESIEKMQNYMRKIPWYVYIIFSVLASLPGYRFFVSDDRQSLMEWKENMANLQSGMVGGLICVLLILVLVVIQSEKEIRRVNALNMQCIREETEQYREMSRIQNETRKFRHDYMAHLETLISIANNGTLQEINNYLSELFGASETIKYIYTNNVIGDAIVNKYASKAKNDGVKLSFVGRFPDSINIFETDLCIVLSNLLSNAYDAVLKCYREKNVVLEVSNYEGHLFIRIRNTIETPPKIVKGKFVSDKAYGDHGIGLENVKEALKRCNGRLEWKISGDIMIFDVVI